MLRLTSTNLISATAKAEQLRPWAVKVREHCATADTSAFVEYRVTPRTWKKRGIKNKHERWERAFYFVRIEFRKGQLFADCHDRAGNQCKAHEFGRQCWHVGQVVIRLNQNAQREQKKAA